MRQKGAYQLAHMIPFLAKSPGDFKWPYTPENHVLASNTRGPEMGIGDSSPQDFNHGLRQSPEAPSHLHKGVSPQDQGNPQLQLKLDSLCRNQGWYIYGIIYHCVPFFLRNTMVMFSGPHNIIPTPVLQSITHFEGRLFSHSVLHSLAATRRPFEDPSHLTLQELGCNFLS
ncbi:hypothetical protein O181_025875 [Austropuccinia psidii MF-1]|uniref:Uncharacterized protein n=1 Tax=Austropuccinia psidii MF-1 TaxID=1389203 RepID=A0A9Q3H1M4_9BASI|nr:hypothetical protein [Austropuccinia psidii MF-1]